MPFISIIPANAAPRLSRVMGGILTGIRMRVIIRENAI
jgi:hypothetical protein